MNTRSVSSSQKLEIKSSQIHRSSNWLYEDFERRTILVSKGNFFFWTTWISLPTGSSRSVNLLFVVSLENGSSHAKH